MRTEDILRQLPLPEQYTGKEIIIESHRRVNDSEEFPATLVQSVERLKDVNNWHKITGQEFSVFDLMDASGTKAAGKAPEPGMHFRVNIAAPGTTAGEGYDWVKVTQAEDFETAGYKGSYLTVRPCDNPASPDPHTAHFYDPSSTSTFLVLGNSKRISAIIIDRNIKVNKDNGSIGDTIRNAVVGSAGIAAFSKIQWQLLADALLGK